MAAIKKSIEKIRKGSAYQVIFSSRGIEKSGRELIINSIAKIKEEYWKELIINILVSKEDLNEWKSVLPGSGISGLISSGKCKLEEYPVQEREVSEKDAQPAKDGFVLLI